MPKGQYHNKMKPYSHPDLCTLHEVVSNSDYINLSFCHCSVSSTLHYNMSLVKLPSELRNLIYELLFPPIRILIAASNDPDPQLRFLGHHLTNRDARQGLRASKNLLLTCRAIYSEVKTFLYVQPTFCFDSVDTLVLFLHRIPLQMRAAIMKLELIRDFSYDEADPLARAKVCVDEALWRGIYRYIEQSMIGTNLSMTRVRLTTNIYICRPQAPYLLCHVQPTGTAQGCRVSRTRMGQRLATCLCPVLRSCHRPHRSCSTSSTDGATY